MVRPSFDVSKARNGAMDDVAERLGWERQEIWQRGSDLVLLAHPHERFCTPIKENPELIELIHRIQQIDISEFDVDADSSDSQPPKSLSEE